ncbi:MAG: FAD-dependent oxidoreductase, partial [Alphaproteobacteria bacterium]|nr:FAD-dependent oxidoreductase [Alphaproteobacteria bacterium]
MKSQNTIIVKDLVLVGGGHAHVQVLRNFGMKPMPGVRVTMIAREVAAPYSGRLPGLIAGHYGFDDAHIDLRRLARFAGAQFFNDTVKSIDLDAKKLVCGDRPPISFDVLSINSGSSPDMKGIPGAAEHTVPVKPIDELLARFEATKNRISTNAGPVRIGVAGGVELLLSLQHRLRQGLGDQEHIVCHLVTDADEILPTHNRSVRRAFARVLAARGVTVHTGRRVTAVEKRAGGPVLVCQGGFEIPLDHVFWATTASAPHWLEKTGLPLDEGGFIAVQDTLQSLVDPTVFAAGDIASVASHPRPKSGVFAVRQGPPLIRNIRRVLTGRAAKPFAPQKRFLSLISTGDRRAVASWGPIAASGTGIWKWKDWIDARFMEKFNDLPEMDDDDTLDLASGLASPETIAALGDHTMRCGGCGAKVGA